jgi:CRP/FNR family transcriptional regulator
MLIRNGEKFTNLYVIRTGFFKSYVALENGNQQVTGFRIAGEMLGLDGIATNQHTCNVIAQEDAEVCTMPFHRFEKIVRDISLMQSQLHKILSREIFFESETKLMLGGMRAEVRLVAFLLNLVDRQHARGLSQSEVELRMTRKEIGSYLGISPETVSRIFSKLTKERMLEADNRIIRILRIDLLCDLADHLA